jgi:catechol 2,3-dioxygenase-like lactoylglutathione lyase family enzyme
VTGPGHAGAPRVGRVLETGLYVADPARAAAFYVDVLGLRVIAEGERLTALDAGGGSVLLLFRRGATDVWADLPEGRIPPHGADGPSHFAFAIDAGELDAWRSRLRAHGVEVESEVAWPRGGRSLYFRDPDGHSLELATPGVWETY